MNKENVYIEPEDDITDIITKIEKSKSKIVALVPPKKAGVFRSVVNIKLIAKAGKNSDKSVVLVTTDPSITKLAAATKLPVAKNLQSAPEVPALDTDIDEETKEDLVEPSEEETPEEVEEEADGEEDNDDIENDTDDDEGEDEVVNEDDKEEDKKKKKPAKKSKNKFVNWIKNHKKLTIFGSILLLGLIGFLIWAFIFAPKVDILISIKTDQNNFSEALTFVKEQSQENAAEGKLYLEERKIETVQEVQFEATGKKNRGEKATGEVLVSGYFKYNRQASTVINAGDRFTISGLSYVASKSTPLVYNGEGSEDCKNKENPLELVTVGCEIEEAVPVAAVEAGEKYNISASPSGWETIAAVNVRSEKPMSGGTDDVYTVVQQIDVEKAKSELSAVKEEENKQKLYETIPKDSIIMESTYSQTTSATTATPAVDEEVKDGVKPVLKTTTTTSVFIIDKTKLEEFLRIKVNLPEDKKIFEIRDAYIDNFREGEGGNFTGKLKAIYFTGPRITETEVVDKVRGHGLGDAQHIIRDIGNVVDVRIDKSYPWVFTIPSNSNKITINFEIMDQDGQKIEEKNEETPEAEAETEEGKEE